MPIVSAPPGRRARPTSVLRGKPVEGALTFPEEPLDVLVEIAPGADPAAIPGTWVFQPITSDVMLRDGGIVITVGRAEGAGSAEPGTVRSLWKNPDGVYTRTNPASTLAGGASRNLPLQVTVDPGTGGIVRARQYVISRPPRWSRADTDHHMPTVAGGVLRRLGQGTSSARSALAQHLLGLGPVAYWPCEDASGVTLAASLLSGHSALQTHGGVSFGSDSGLVGSSALPTWPDGSRATATVPPYAHTGGWTATCVVKVGSAPASENILVEWAAAGTVRTWRVTLSPQVGTDELRVYAYNAVGSLLATAVTSWTDSVTGAELYGEHVLIALSVAQSGPDVAVDVWTIVADGDGGAGSTTIAAQTLGAVTSARVAPDATMAGTTLGHLAVMDDWFFTVTPAEDGTLDLFGLAGALVGWPGEGVVTRVRRVCAFAGVQVSFPRVTNPLYTGTILGPQLPGTVADILTACAVTDGGLLAEDGFGLAFTVLDALENRPVDMALDYTAGHLSGIEPADDDRQVRNDVTATRVGGGAARHVDPDSVDADGRYEATVSLTLPDDGSLPDHASWRAHLGVEAGLRYAVTLDLVARPELIAAWALCLVGSRITVAHPPEDVGPDDLDLIIDGWTETIGHKVWEVRLNCSPFRPYEVFQIDHDRLGRVDTAGSSLVTAVDADDTSWTVASTGIVWTPTAGEWPFQLDVEGERVTVTAVAGATSPQTLTVTRSVNGVTQAHTAGADIRLWKPGVISL